MDFEQAEECYRTELLELATPDSLFDRRWALTVLDGALFALRQEFLARNQESLFEELKSYLHGQDSEEGYADIAARLDLSVGAVRVSAHRMRKRCGELIRTAVIDTLMDEKLADDEIRSLFRAPSAP